MPFTKSGPNQYTSPSGRKFTKKQVGAYYATGGFKKPVKISNKKLGKNVLGETQWDQKSQNKAKRVLIDVKKHKNAKQLASTVKHELMHVKHPKMTEKDVYKKTSMKTISPAEQTKLLSKVRMKALNYKSGAIKRKFKMGNGTTAPGDFISKMNESKSENIKSDNQQISKTQLSIRGLV